MGTTVYKRGALLLASGIVFTFSPHQVRAEEQAVSLKQAMEYALQNNGDLKALREEKGIRDAGKVRAGLLPNPTLDLEAATGALTGSNNENSLALGVSQEFSLAGKRGKRLTIAERELEIYRWRLADRERLLRDEVATAFYGALLAKERVNLADSAISLNRQLFDVAKERLAAGDIPELEMNLVKVELARSEGARIEAAKAMLQSQSRLWTLMGLSSGNQPAIAGKLESGSPMIKSLADLKRLASAGRPDLKALEAEKDKGEAEIVLAEAEGVPNLTAGFFYRYEERADATGAGEEKIHDNLLGIRLSVPLPVFDRNQAGIQEARARRGSSESRLVAFTRNIEREVDTAHNSYLNTTMVQSLYKADIIPQLEENLKLTQEAYRLGEVGILAVIQEQKKFFELNDGYLTALHDRQTALVKLETVTASELTGGEK